MKTFQSSIMTQIGHEFLWCNALSTRIVNDPDNVLKRIVEKIYTHYQLLNLIIAYFKIWLADSHWMEIILLHSPKVLNLVFFYTVYPK